MEWMSLVSFSLGIIVTKIFDELYEGYKNKIKRKSVKKKVENHVNNENYIDDKILLTAAGHNSFLCDETINTKETSKEFYLKFPEGLVSKLSQNAHDFNLEEDKCYKELSKIGESIGISNFEQKIETCRDIVARKFINREDGMYFNGYKYGILCSDAFSRTSDRLESPILYVEFYKTDYFTHSVMGELVKMLRNEKLLPENISLKNLNGDYSIFRTSMGLSLIVEIPKTNQIILTRRSKNSSYSEGKEWIYTSVTEALSFTDMDEYKRNINFELWVERGLFEELGIDSSMYKKDSLEFYDMFFEKYFYQDNITASIELKDDKTFKDIKELKGKDHDLELEDIFTLDLDKKSIIKFIKENKNNMRPQTLYTLQSYLLRKGIKIDKKEFL